MTDCEHGGNQPLPGRSPGRGVSPPFSALVLAGVAVLGVAALLWGLFAVAPSMPTGRALTWLGRWIPWLGAASVAVAAAALVAARAARPAPAGTPATGRGPGRFRGVVLLSAGCIVATVVAIPLAFLWEVRLGDVRLTSCMSNAMQLTRATQMYLADYAGRFPDAKHWSDTLRPRLGNTGVDRQMNGVGMFGCPEAPDLSCAYAFNASLSRVRSEAIHDPGETVLIFESSRGWNAAGGPDLLPANGRHLGRDVYAFVDGHARYQPRSAPLPRW